MKNKIVLVFPHQLFEHHPAITADRHIFIVEHPRYFTDFNFHVQKIVLHRASCKAFYDRLKDEGYHVSYVAFNQVTDFFTEIKKPTLEEVHIVDVVDHKLEGELKKTFAKKLIIHESPAFLSNTQWLIETLGDKDHYVMNGFYIAQRKHLDILISKGKAAGGKWSYDDQNRLKMPKDVHVPKAWHVKEDDYIQEAKQYTKKHFKDNPGSCDDFRWPVTHAQAKKSLHDFLEHRLALFGPYQDAIDTQHDIMFHSLLSSSLNNGLLTPAFVMEQTLAYCDKHKVPLNSLEGFVRQIIGWREFVRGIYIIKGEQQRKQNFFDHKNKLLKSFWNASTGIVPLDYSISKVLKISYAHHIERLMVLGNFMLLTRIKPDDVYTWFMELFIDAYDWVMVPNVYGMSQYADGGLMTTKPYFSGSNYIRKMSNFKKGQWCEIWDALYWTFVYDHQTLIKKNPRLASMGMYLRKMQSAQLHKHLLIGREFLKGSN